jgi:hypothetical protein
MLDDPPSADARSDVFQLGILLWEMLANRPLFSKSRPIASSPLSPSDLAEVERHIREMKLPAVDDGRAGAPLPQGVVRLVERLLEREQLARFKDAGEVVAAFDDLASGNIATSADVVVWVERTARDVLEDRRSTLQTASGDRVSLSPESRSETARPPGPEVAVRVTLPNMPPLTGFSISEAPTARRKATPPTGLPAPSAAEVRDAVAQAKAEDAVEEIEGADLVSEPPGSLGSKVKAAFSAEEAATGEPVEAPPLASPDRSRARLVVYAIVVALVAGALLFWQQSGESDSTATTPSVTASPNANEPTPPTATAPEPDEPATAAAEPSAAPPLSAEPEPSAAPKATGKGPSEKVPVPAPTRPKKDFRPKGI